ncbi:competence/damage-inducible protein A [Mesobacillus maritimus]|uniref:Putative competence-damage inducible protein n=1 Tax=Mesobacillus maritimus TaxID=1643336 RepID=A0ABS7KAK8_9BACI|nr:competence/damage-inducible protein A [Mesobacillus maritimus]MBY0099277.1 competence/damage-inducible protein A [Mesobacillus maritimus]
MNAEIIAVGSELLLGQINNTNARFLSAQLASIGVNVYFHTVVGDNPGRLEKVLEVAKGRSDLIILTGGLGPTKDDLTKETIARQLSVDLAIDEVAMKSIEGYFNKTNRVMTENNRKQALVLKGAEVLQNDHGMAPGMLFTKGDQHYMLLPGPPSEMEPMFTKYGIPAITMKMSEQAKIVSRVLRFFGIGEAALETKLEDLIESQSNPTIAPLASESEVTIRLTASHASEETAAKLIDELEAKILARVGDYFYGYDDTSLINEVFKLLKTKGLTIAAAESLTGGLFQEQLTSLAGASSVLKGGVVCYTNEAKIDIVKVRKETISGEGAVSAACAEELAQNVSKLLGADIGISFTGVAGPDELEGHPAGTVFVGIHIKGKPTFSKMLQLAGTREINRVRAVKHGCRLLINSLKE